MNSNYQEAEISIKEILVKDLWRYYSENFSEEHADILKPITELRAKSQINNPVATDDDVGLLLAYQGTKLVGYLGLMPGLAYINQKNTKVYWATAWFVHSEIRGRSVGSLLMNKALQYNKAVILTGMSDDSERVCIQKGFSYLPPLHYWRFKIKPFAITRYLSRLLKIFNRNASDTYIRIFNKQKKILYKLLIFIINPLFRKLIVSESDFLIEDEISNPANNGSFLRDSKIINWMLKYNWIKSSFSTDESISDYAFSDTRERFYYKLVYIHASSDKLPSGYFVFSYSMQSGISKMKVLDYYFKNEHDGSRILEIVFRYAKELHVDSIDIPNQLAIKIKGCVIKYFPFEKMERRYLYSISEAAQSDWKNTDKIIPDYCDGDTAFS